MDWKGNKDMLDQEYLISFRVADVRFEVSVTLPDGFVEDQDPLGFCNKFVREYSQTPHVFYFASLYSEGRIGKSEFIYRLDSGMNRFMAAKNRRA